MLPHTFLHFWQWAGSDLVSNAWRGVLAEYIVGLALDAIDRVGVRLEWDRYDLCLSNGLTVEVKSAAYVQTWAQNRPSTIRFSIGERIGWNAETGLRASVAARTADVYVFALLHHEDRDTLDPLQLDQWLFYVLSTAVLNEKIPRQKTIFLSTLEKLGAKPVAFADLAATVWSATHAKTTFPTTSS